MAVAVLTAVILVVCESTRRLAGAAPRGALVPAVLTFAQRRQSLRFGCLHGRPDRRRDRSKSTSGRVLYATRTFFGVYRVTEDPTGRDHWFVHGTTLHGTQSLAPAPR